MLRTKNPNRLSSGRQLLRAIDWLLKKNLMAFKSWKIIHQLMKGKKGLACDVYGMRTIDPDCSASVLEPQETSAMSKFLLFQACQDYLGSLLNQRGCAFWSWGKSTTMFLWRSRIQCPGIITLSHLVDMMCGTKSILKKTFNWHNFSRCDSWFCSW